MMCSLVEQADSRSQQQDVYGDGFWRTVGE